MKMTEQLQRILALDLWPVVGGYKLHLEVSGPSARWYWGEKDDTADFDNNDPPLWLHHDIATPVFEKFLADELVKARCTIKRNNAGTKVTLHGICCFHKDHLTALLDAAKAVLVK